MLFWCRAQNLQNAFDEETHLHRRVAKEQAALLSTRSSWSGRNLAEGDSHTPFSSARNSERELDESLEEPLYPPPPPPSSQRKKLQYEQSRTDVKLTGDADATMPPRAQHSSRTSRLGSPPVSVLTNDGRAISPGTGR